MKDSREGEGLSALKKFKAETGLSTKDVSELLGVPVDTMSGWLSVKEADPPRDFMLLRAGRKIKSDHTCPLAGDFAVVLSEKLKTKQCLLYIDPELSCQALRVRKAELEGAE